ncbi:hypothetical protein [Peribacillus asahii]|uniref:hypothetical protein n=1 Tax=Peribacillus asahii TaxID=228899 RepID=UPI0020796FCE|nr:hypothetical protein [Peribacillus asahii]USK84796.1 hypothetical protein LIT35_20800 [Peribacillus asahii]
MGKRDKHHHRNLRDLLERIQSASEQIQEEISDIRDLLRRAERLMQQLPQNGNGGNQFFVSDQGVFLQVAPPPAAAPPPPTPAAPVLTPDQRRLVRDIREIGRQLRRLQDELLSLLFGFGFALARFLEEEDVDEAFIVLLSFTAVQIGIVEREIAELRGRLLATVLELEVSLGL